jgi:hypothetical protein
VLLLTDPQDSELGQYRLHESEYYEHPLAQLYSMYWEKGDEHLMNCESCIPLPSDLVPESKVYVFHQYSFAMQRINDFRRKHNDTTYLPPGLALVGSPGIGEQVPIHLFI